MSAKHRRKTYPTHCTLIFSKGYEGKGVMEGVRYGLYIGIWMSVGMAYGSFAMIKIPYSLAAARVRF